MTLQTEFKELVLRWREKANSYNTENVEQLIDRFFTLYVAYNALYVETAAYLRRKAEAEGKDGYNIKAGNFPDKKAATLYVLDLLGSRSLLGCLNEDPNARKAIEDLKNLINPDSHHRFRICLDPVTGEPRKWTAGENETDKEEDQKLFDNLNSTSSNFRAEAILQIIYEIRCNMFHGRKGVNPIQRDILGPVTILLEKIIDRLFSELDNAQWN